MTIWRGNQTYNPNSRNGYTGEEGCGFKYPVNYYKSRSDAERSHRSRAKWPIDCIEPECIETMEYAFGSNHLSIGKGIIEALEYIEDTYGIDFNKLEEKRTDKRKKRMLKIEEKLKQGQKVNLSSGLYRVGIDLPAGKYVVLNEKKDYSRYLDLDICDEGGDTVEDYFTTDNEINIRLKEKYLVKVHSACRIKEEKD